MEGFNLTTNGKDEGYVRHVLEVPEERSSQINDFIHTAAQTRDRSAGYIAETLKSVTEMCQNAAEVAYAAYTVGVVLGPTDVLKMQIAGIRGVN